MIDTANNTTITDAQEKTEYKRVMADGRDATTTLRWEMRNKLIDEYVKSKLAGEKITNTAIAIRAGYSPKSAPYRASQILNDPRTIEKIAKLTEKIRIGENYISDWTLQKSIETATRMFVRLSKDTKPGMQAVAFKYKENLDKLNRLLVEQGEIKTMIVYKELSQLCDDDLLQVAQQRVN
jgi:hypothetical protein